MKITKIIFTILIILIYSDFNTGLTQEYKDPQLIGGAKELDYFICNEIVYPPEALKNKVQGTVKVLLTISEKGEIINYKITESVSEELDQEALRIVRKTKWEPAISMAKPVKGIKKVEIKFHIKKYRKNCKKRGYTVFEYGDRKVDSSGKIYETGQLDKSPMPYFEDDKMNLMTFIAKNLKYPDAAYKQNIAGIARVKFIVEPYGKISHVFVENPLGGGCSQEAIRIAKLINWTPGEKNDELVRSWMDFEIKFKLPESGDMDYVPSNSSSSF